MFVSISDLTSSVCRRQGDGTSLQHRISHNSYPPTNTIVWQGCFRVGRRSVPVYTRLVCQTITADLPKRPVYALPGNASPRLTIRTPTKRHCQALDKPRVWAGCNLRQPSQAQRINWMLLVPSAATKAAIPRSAMLQMDTWRRFHESPPQAQHSYQLQIVRLPP